MDKVRTEVSVRVFLRDYFSYSEKENKKRLMEKFTAPFCSILHESFPGEHELTIKEMDDLFTELLLKEFSQNQ